VRMVPDIAVVGAHIDCGPMGLVVRSGHAADLGEAAGNAADLAQADGSAAGW
jgi:hypothetical protein